ncbi:MAG: hypothetical protein KC912_14135 [Proteobacteria bacterium]|nr:hypothetical protein [Pseudomonadota bacterium]
MYKTVALLLLLPGLAFGGPKTVTSTTEAHFEINFGIISWGSKTTVTETETVDDEAETESSGGGQSDNSGDTTRDDECDPDEELPK